MGPLTRLFSHYKAYHEHGLLQRYMSLMGMVAFPLLYMMRFVRSTPGYDDFALRLFDTLLCVVLFLRDRWPERLKPYYLQYSYAVLVITLPLTFAFTSLKNGGGAAAVGNTFFAVFLLLLLADWRNMIVILLSGFGLAAGLYALTDPNPTMPADYIARLPVLVAGIVGGSLFKYALDQASAERVRRAYASLAGSIAHEMRNPLAQVRHSLEHIRQSLPVPSLRASEQIIDARHIDQLYRHVSQGELAVKRGLQVITMTLDEVNAKPIDPGKLGLVSAADVCAKAVSEFGYDSEQQRARVSVDVRQDFVFRADETAFLFVLFNLLKNALYYLPAYPDATVRICVDSGRISVRDTGPGIAPEVVAGLFQPFRTSGKEAGTGLGLAYCSRVTQSFGGQITCESVLGSHTEFTMTFPVVDAQEIQARHDNAMASARRLLANRRVLIVDDDAAVRTAARAKLMSLSCTVREAADGIEALQALRESPFDLVLLDLNMPRMDGYEVAESVRGGLVPANLGVCLVAHTSEPAHVARVKTANAGFDGFVAKPSEFAAMVEAICAAFETRSRTPARPKGWLEGRHILLADDNAYNRAAVAGYLKHAGATVAEVPDGRAALSALAGAAVFDVVLLDIHMPGLGGVETARAIHAGAAGERHLPILAITAHVGPGLIAEGGAAGIADFLLKPVDPALLQDKLGKLLGLQTGQPATEPSHRSSPQSSPQRASPRQESATALDEGRLRNYLRIGMLQELVDEYVPQVNSLVERLVLAHELGDFKAATSELHSLVGMSGEAGALALYRYGREIYVAMAETGQWPADPGWIDRIGELTASSNHELRSWLAAHGAAALE